jgi:STE24 endopeptidase
MNLYSSSIIGILVVMYTVRLVLSILNYRYRTSTIPENVSHIYSKARYKKWLNYSMENFRFGLITKGVSVVLIVTLLLTGSFAQIATLTQSWTSSELFGSVFFFLVLLIANQLLDTPFEYYQTFVIEAKYGFNKTTKKTFALDIVKNIALTSLLGFGLLSGLYGLVQLFADEIPWFVVGVWAGLSILFVLIAMFNGFFVRLFYKLSPLAQGELRSRIEHLASSVGFRLKRIFVMDASSRSAKLNAFFTGLGKTKEIVLFDTLVAKLTEDEVMSVMAHEIAHSVHKDVHRMILENVIVFGVYATVLGFLFQTPEFSLAFGFEQAHFGFTLILFAVLISPISFLVNVPRMYLSRIAEFKADAYSASKIDKTHMMSALTTLAREDLANLTPHPLYVAFYYSHPPMSERLAALSNLPSLS